MLFPHGRWLLCRASYFDVKYEINPWMSVAHAPHTERALTQWNTLHHTLIRLGAWVEYVDPDKECPDMVFTANAGLVHKNIVVLSRFRHRERQGEVSSYRKWFLAQGYQVFEPTNAYFEGEGDALFAGEALFCGYGFRTDRAVYEEVSQHLGVHDLVYVQLIDPRFYHLDTCFCPLSKDRALFFPAAFSPEARKALESRIELIPVPEDDALKFACNTVVLGKDLVMPAGCEKTYALAAKFGYTAHPVALDEFLKAGGSAKCLSLRL